MLSRSSISGRKGFFTVTPSCLKTRLWIAFTSLPAIQVFRHFQNGLFTFTQGYHICIVETLLGCYRGVNATGEKGYVGVAFFQQFSDGSSKGGFITHKAASNEIGSIGVHKFHQWFLYGRVVSGHKEDC